MLAGPLFSREALTSPRRLKHFLIRAGYIAGLFVLMYTAGQVTFGFQQVRNIGDLARFGQFVFQVFAVVQLTLVMAFALVFAAGNIAQEKDRRTLIILLMTDLRDRELVVGKLLASLLMVIVLIAASIPVFCLLQMLGGVTLAQILWVEALCLAAAMAVGSWGTLVAFWKEKTFQTLAISTLGVVIFLGLVELGIALTGADSGVGKVLAALNPYRSLTDVLNPLGAEQGLTPARVSAAGSVVAMAIVGLLLLLYTIAMVRKWNPSPSVHKQVEETTEATIVERHRNVWNWPIIWREVCTRAYGTRVFLIKLAYLLIALFAAYVVYESAGEPGLVLGMVTRAGAACVGISLLSLILINAQAVTSLTSERDGQTLELLLVTDVTAKEFVFGKLGGVYYNAKEVLLVPILLLGLVLMRGELGVENFIYLIVGYLTLAAFAAMLGLHAGLSYDNSRTAIANSLGTMFFLFVGIFICLVLIVEARSSFALQFTPFLVFILGGSLGLWASLTSKNPSAALTFAAAILPFFTFYAITSFLLGNTLGVCLSVVLAYGFTVVAMLVPAVSEFDVALGRTTHDQG